MVILVMGQSLVLENQHSHPQRPRSFWSPPRIPTSGKVQFSKNAQRNRFVFSANQICQTWTRAFAEWREVRKSWTSGVRPSWKWWFLVILTKSSAASGDKNGESDANPEHVCRHNDSCISFTTKLNSSSIHLSNYFILQPNSLFFAFISRERSGQWVSAISNFGFDFWSTMVFLLFGVSIVCSFEGLLLPEQRSERTDS